MQMRLNGSTIISLVCIRIELCSFRLIGIGFAKTSLTNYTRIWLDFNTLEQCFLAYSK